MSRIGSLQDPERCTDPICEYQYPHKHGWVTPQAGAPREAIIHLVEDPRAEVRDPDTGEVIFPAIKGPLRLIEGGKPSDRPPAESKAGSPSNASACAPATDEQPILPTKEGATDAAQ